jgi:outer membrane protein OmpA-like peptidoglycan-associated protein
LSPAPPSRRLVACLPALVFIAGAAPSRPAAASDGLILEARAGVGVSAMISAPQRDRGFKSGFVPDLRPGLRLGDAIAAELVLATWFFPRQGGSGSGRATLLGGGLRWDPRLASWLSWFLDGHGGLALTGPSNRFMADAGTGFEVWINRSLAIGPVVRYAQLVDRGPDPRFWSAGLSATMTWGAAADEPPSLGPVDSAREERQKSWEQARQRELRSPRHTDRDHDGVPDDRDICPDEPPGPHPDPNMTGCPRKEADSGIALAAAGDQDGDGVPDADDKCPNRPFGEHPDPLAMGCPLPDRDQDGVPDMDDACPGKPGIPTAGARTNGCPGLATIDRGTIGLARPILFSPQGDDIFPSSLPVLQAVADTLKATSAIKRISIEAHTDSSLSSMRSLELSRRRAEAVRRWLVANGVAPDRLVTLGHGDSRPLTSNRTARSRAANARVELVILDPPEGAGLSR